MAKNRVASELFKYAGLKEVQFIEKLTAESEAEVPAPAELEVEAEAETEVKEEPSESQE
jgi:FKBP-type peptidyl-prolyl cis-trans isomerase SlyD